MCKITVERAEKGKTSGKIDAVCKKNIKIVCRKIWKVFLLQRWVTGTGLELLVHLHLLLSNLQVFVPPAFKYALHRLRWMAVLLVLKTYGEWEFVLKFVCREHTDIGN